MTAEAGCECSEQVVVDVLVVGAGQSALAFARRLGEAGIEFLVIDAAARLGASWRHRWDSLRLFTPRPYSTLAGLEYPEGTPRLPAKDDVADYLERYAQRFEIPVRLGTRVTKLDRHLDGDGFRACADGVCVSARRVVIASGAFNCPHIPSIAERLDRDVWQSHAADYRDPAGVPDGKVLVVGAGNTGAQLAVELHRAGRHVTLAAPQPPWFLPERILGLGIYSWLRATRILTADRDAWISRRLRQRVDAIIGTDLRALLRAGDVKLRPRVTDGRDRTVVFADGSVERVSSIMWATGYRPAFGWMQIPGALDASGAPVHERGLSSVPGLAWLGLPWQTRLDSGLIHGADHDAARLAEILFRR